MSAKCCSIFYLHWVTYWSDGTFLSCLVLWLISWDCHMEQFPLQTAPSGCSYYLSSIPMQCFPKQNICELLFSCWNLQLHLQVRYSGAFLAFCSLDYTDFLWTSTATQSFSWLGSHSSTVALPGHSNLVFISGCFTDDSGHQPLSREGVYCCSLLHWMSVSQHGLWEGFCSPASEFLLMIVPISAF